MALETPTFVHEFKPGAIRFGRGCVEDLGDALADRDVERALVVCGRNVGANPDVMEPIRAGLGDRLAGVFDETTPAKSVETAIDAVEAMRETDADALVGVGGGSSLDVATVTSVLAARGCSLDEVREEVAAGGGIGLPDDPGALTPLVPVPTTLAGADLSTGAGINVPMDGRTVASGVGGDALMPAALFYDPALFETTPMDALAGSAMNGFDKGVEALYSRHANPITDATATRGLRYLRAALPRLRDADDPGVVERVVVGTILVQYGVSTRGAPKLSIIHAFGHALRGHAGMQQGVAHAIVAPHVLEFVFERAEARRETLAAALGAAGVAGMGGDETAEAVVGAVREVRDGLDLPARLRGVSGLARDDLRRVAELTRADALVAHGPENLDPSVDDLEAVLEAAW